jgi:hypothetical protein
MSQDDQINQRVDRLDKLYRTISTPIAVASTLALGAMSYYGSLPGNPLQLQLPGDLIWVYSFTLFFIIVSVVSYAASYVKGPLFFRYLAILSILSSLVVPMAIAQAWLKLEDPWAIAAPILLVIISFLLTQLQRPKRLISRLPKHSE